MEVVFIAIVLIAVSFWVAVVINGVRIYHNLKYGKAFSYLMDPTVIFSLERASLYLNDQGMIYFKRARFALAGFLICCLILLVAIVLTGLF